MEEYLRWKLMCIKIRVLHKNSFQLIVRHYFYTQKFSHRPSCWLNIFLNPTARSNIALAWIQHILSTKRVPKKLGLTKNHINQNVNVPNYLILLIWKIIKSGNLGKSRKLDNSNSNEWNSQEVISFVIGSSSVWICWN